jgi:antitoxin FitA
MGQGRTKACVICFLKMVPSGEIGNADHSVVGSFPLSRLVLNRFNLRSKLALTNMIAMIAMIAGGTFMASITIRNLDDDLKRKLRVRAAHRNRSMEEEARDILRTALAQEPAETLSLADAIRELVEPLGGIELELPPRGPMPEPPNFK